MNRRGSLGVGIYLSLFIVACGGEAPPPAVSAPPAERPVAVATAHPSVETVIDRVTLPAELLPSRRALLAAEASGVIEALSFEEGSFVAAGATLARIDTRALEQAVAEAKALFAQADSQARRAEALAAKRSVTEQQKIDAVTARDVAAVRLASAELALEKSRVRAPWGGRIAVKRVEVGDYVVPGQPIAELLEVSRLKVRATAPAADVPYLKVGAPVEIRIDSLAAEVFAGKLVRLGAEVDAASRTLAVEAELSNRDGTLKPGMLARLEVPRRTLENALLVPLEAVVDLGGVDVAYVVEEGRARRRPVTLGPVVGTRVVVTAGLSAGDRVVTTGAAAIADGQLVAEASAP